jgi:hypothetical protein
MQTATLNIGSVNVTDTASDLDTDLRRARTLAVLMDSQFEFAGIRFGLDGIVGLFPVVGDTISAAASLYPIYVARKHKLGHDVVSRMAVNVAVDYMAGLIPLVGDVVDVAFKANMKNLALLEKAAELRR